MIWLLAAVAAATEFPLLPEGATWSYLDTGVDPGVGWADPDFDDALWASGPAPLGYGIWDAQTIVAYGPDPLDKYVTTWFRTDFNAVGVAAMTGLVLSLRVDDGAVVYLNGTEVHRRNLPDGPITADTFATVNVFGIGSSEFVRVPIDPTLLVEGDNTVAVEVHQQSASNPDIALDLALDGYDGATEILRGPYLQRTSDDGVIVRWRTLGPSDSTVWYGSSVGALVGSVNDPEPALDHEVQLTGLGPSSTWFYGVGSSVDGMLVGDDLDHTFTTHPPPGSRVPMRIWVLGDSGTADADAEAVRDAWTAYNAGQPPDVWLMLGDNAYGSGTDDEYQDAVFDFYPDTLRKVSLWSTLGNHDGYSASSLTQTGPYYDLFSFPTAGEVGGEPSGTEAYYSFDIGNVHFVNLDSYGTDRAVGGAMSTWLEADLAATTADWVIAFFHHPPYSKGSHNSDFELGMVEMRANALPILEDYGVDLVLSGHSHSYERSFLLDGHYGTSGTFDLTMALDDSDGTRDDGFAYRKPSVGPAAHEGAVYVVAGSSGKTSGGTLDHPAMFVSLDELGSLVIDVDGDSLDAVFLRDDGSLGDRFAIDKGVTAIVSIEGPRIVGVNDQATWTALALHPDGSEVSSYDWDMGDGTVGNGAAITHTYTAEATVPVTLTVYDQAGLPVVRTFDVLVDDGIPDIDSLTVPLGTEGLPVTVSAVASDVGGGAITYVWTYDDGTVVNGQVATHTWAQDGTYAVTLTVTDDEGEVEEIEVLVTVQNANPTIDEVVVTPGAEGELSRLSAVASDLGVEDTLTYRWFAQGQEIVGEEASFALPGGAQTVELSVFDDDGGSTTEDVVVDVAERPPEIVGATIWPALDEGEEGSFSVVAVDPGQDVLTFTWTFGDGSQAQGAVVQHRWAKDGTYPLEVIVDDGDGSVISERWTIAIRNAPPVFGDVAPEPVARAGEPWTFAPDVADPGGDPLRWSLVGPEGATVTKGVVTWTPTGDDVGQTVWFELRVTDDAGLSATERWAVVVEAGGCGCATGGTGGGFGGLAILGALALRRRRQPAGS